MPFTILTLPDERCLVVQHSEIFRDDEAWCSLGYRARLAVLRLASLIEDQLHEGPWTSLLLAMLVLPRVFKGAHRHGLFSVHGCDPAPPRLPEPTAGICDGLP